MIFKKLVSAAVCAAMLSGCMMGPNYKRPELDLPVQQAGEEEYSVFENYQWWEMFGDERLNKLETEALLYNRDLRQAIARVDEARAAVGSAVADQLPTIAAQGGSGRAGSYYGSGQVQSTGTIVASFELDLWGKYRRLSEAARAQLLSTMASKDTVLLTLTAQVASTYFTLLALDSQLDTATKTLQTRKESVRIYTSRYNAGYVTEVDLRRIEADMYSVAATVKSLELSVATTETALSVLVGRSPREIVQGFDRGGKLLDEIDVPQVPAGLSSAFLAKRPDVRSAEGMLIAANAQIGAARAAYFPDITLTGAAGYASYQLNELFRGPSGMWAFAGQLTQPIFAGGRIVSQNKAAKAQYQEMLAAYEQTVQNAFKEALDALNGHRLYSEIYDIYLGQTKALRRGYELTKKQEDAGLIGTMELLDVERNLLQAEMSLATARQNELNSLVSLAKAFGGGWNERCGFGPFEAQVEAQRAAFDQQKADQRAAALKQAELEQAALQEAAKPEETPVQAAPQEEQK